MTNPPDRVWVTMDANGYCEHVADNPTDAAAVQRDLQPSVMHPGPIVTHEYRLHRPIQWRTGVPDAETVERGRCGGGFAVRVEDGSLLRNVAAKSRTTINEPWQFVGWSWDGNWIYLDVTHWYPEDEMPEGETT